MVEVYTFSGGSQGAWRVTDIRCLRGAALAPVERIDIRRETEDPRQDCCAWTLRGLTSNLRYTTRAEADSLGSSQPGLARAEASCAALIPIHKSAAWWGLAQDERRAIFEEVSHHTAIGLAYLPAIARRLHHCRDLGEPFDFLTWFEFAPEHIAAFDGLVAALRASREWDFVDREVDIRLERSG